jgi:hypothetical protein
MCSTLKSVYYINIDVFMQRTQTNTFHISQRESIEIMNALIYLNKITRPVAMLVVCGVLVSACSGGGSSSSSGGAVTGVATPSKVSVVNTN